MVGSRLPQAVVATILVGIVVASASTMALAGGATGIAQAGETPSSSELFEINEDVDAWERSILSLRADADGAAYALPNAAWQIETTNGDQGSLNRDPVPVYDDGQDVTVTFDPDRTRKSDDYLAGQQTQLVAAHLDETDSDDVPRSASAAFDLLDVENADRANENAKFAVVDEGELDAGVNEYTDTAEAGHTVYFLVTVKEGDGVQVADGDVTGVDGHVTVVGMEHVVARAGAGSVDAPHKVTKGKTASFDVDASELDAADAGSTINQGVVVYDEDKLVDQRFLIELNDEVSPDFSVAQNATFHSDVDEVNGVARLDDQVSVFGRQVGDRRVTGSAGLGFLFDFVGEQASTDMPGIEDDSADSVVLDASTTMVSGSSADRTVEVETYKNWSTGEYRWVYVGVGQDSSDVVTQTGTIHVKKKSKGGSSGGDPGGSTGGDTGGSTGGDTGGDDGGDSGGSGGAGTGGSTGGTGAPDAGNETETETEKDAGTGGDDDDDDETDEPEPASVEITDASLGATEITAGDSVDVSVTLENDGGKEGTATVRIRANDSVVATEQVTVGAGETVTETVSVTFDEAGTYEITASGTEAGTLTVTEAGGGDDTPGGAEPPADGGGLPFVAIGVVVVVAGGAGAFYFFWVR